MDTKYVHSQLLFMACDACAVLPLPLPLQNISVPLSWDKEGSASLKRYVAQLLEVGKKVGNNWATGTPCCAGKCCCRAAAGAAASSSSHQNSRYLCYAAGTVLPHHCLCQHWW